MEQQSWIERFKYSRERYARRVNKEYEADDIPRTCWYNFTKAGWDNTPIQSCESVIEIVMAYALYLVGVERCRYFETWLLDPKWKHPRHADMDVLLITPQAPIGSYRVDFLLTYRGLDILEWGEGRECPFQTEMIVECDGHEFHQKNREQAAHDGKRDRELQDLGFKVFHFTGREIWNNAFGCADQAIQALIKEADRQVRPAPARKLQ